MEGCWTKTWVVRMNNFIRELLTGLGIPVRKRKTAFLNAYRLLLNPITYTTGCFARDNKGRPVSPTDPEATSWCSFGAINKEITPYFTPTLDNTKKGFARLVVDDLTKEAHARYPECKGQSFPYMHDEVLTPEQVLDIWKAVGQKHGWIK